MIMQVLHCPYCQGTDIVKHGLSPEGKQRYRCRTCREGRGRTFLLAYAYAGLSPEVKQQIVDMAMNASGIRDTVRLAPRRGYDRAQGRDDFEYGARFARAPRASAAGLRA